LFNHHQHLDQLTDAEREKLLLDGAAVKGMVMHSELAAADRGRSQVRVEVRFKDGQAVEFNEELANLYQPAPDSQQAQRLAQLRTAQQLRHPDRVPKIQIPLSDGQRVPVRYDPEHRSRMVLDVPAMQKQALHDYIERELKPKPQPTAGGRAVGGTVAAGPPWAVPTHCPNCGAPVDQAKTSHDADPHCPFCIQPIPVSPLAR
jgi:hypothetical protein